MTEIILGLLSLIIRSFSLELFLTLYKYLRQKKPTTLKKYASNLTTETWQCSELLVFLQMKSKIKNLNKQQEVEYAAASEQKSMTRSRMKGSEKKMFRVLTHQQYQRWLTRSNQLLPEVISKLDKFITNEDLIPRGTRLIYRLI